MDNSTHNIYDFDFNYLSEHPSFNFADIINNSNDNANFLTDCISSSPYSVFNIDCSYSSVLDVSLSNNDLTILSLNIQSINSKFSDFKDLLASFQPSSPPDIICLQELWQFPSDADFNLPGYHPFTVYIS